MAKQQTPKKKKNPPMPKDPLSQAKFLQAAQDPATDILSFHRTHFPTLKKKQVKDKIVCLRKNLGKLGGRGAAIGTPLRNKGILSYDHIF